MSSHEKAQDEEVTGAAEPSPEVAEDAAGERENPPVAQDHRGKPKEQPWGAP